MQVSFIVPLYNCLTLTQAMLASLQATLPAGLAHEIVFVDDGSTDGTREWLAKVTAPCRAVLNDKNLGFAGACNRGAATAQGEFLFFLNNDLVLLPHWLEPMLAAFHAHPDTGLVGNVQLNFATGAVDHAGVFFNHKGKPEHDTSLPVFPTSYREVDALTGACFAIRRTQWEQLGGFDPAYVNGCEDVDLCLRARQMGLTSRVALRSRVRHHVSASTGRKLRDEHNTVRLVRRWHSFIQSRIMRGCCQAVLAAAWEDPRDYSDQALARDAFLYLAGFKPWPSPRLQAAVSAALALELSRWATLLENAPAQPVREIAGQFFPTERSDPAVI